MALLLKNSEGKQSLSFTMLYTTFVVALVWFGLSVFKIPHIKDFDVTIASGFLSPLMALYFGRRWNDAKNSTPSNTNPSQS